MDGRQMLDGARVLLDDGLRPASVLIGAGRILDVLPPGAETTAERVVLPPDSVLAPGFIDAQANGGGGVLFNDGPDTAGIAAIAAAHRRCGTTGLLPTLITDAPDRLIAAAGALRAAAGQDGVLGLHLEGPFINPARAGVHDPRHMRTMTEADAALLLRLAADLPRHRVLLTLAPESCSDARLARLAAGGVILSAGHSTASPERLAAAIRHGLRGFTHLFNAMPPMAAREPGPAAAAMTDPDTWCGVIADGVHVHPAMLRLLLAAKPDGRVFLVTDAMPPLGTGIDRFALGGRTVFRRDGRLTTAEGVLAGADLTMSQAVRFCVDRLGLDPARALRMASLDPARFLRLDGEHGRIAPGRRADLVHLSAGWDVLGTWLGGAREIVAGGEELSSR